MKVQPGDLLLTIQIYTSGISCNITVNFIQDFESVIGWESKQKPVLGMFTRMSEFKIGRQEDRKRFSSKCLQKQTFANYKPNSKKK